MSAAQAALAGVLAHEVPVRDAVGAADLHDPVALEVEVRRLGEVLEHVLDRDRLGQGADPARGDHDRQAVDQRADHLERRAPGADDDRRAQLDGRHPRFRQDPPDLLAAGQVARQVLVVAKPAEVDDPPHPGQPRGRAERLGPAAVGLPVVRARGHRVDQVVRGVDPGEGRPQRRGLPDVAAHDLGRRRQPRRPAGPGGGSSGAGAGRALEARVQPPADVAGRAGQEDQRRGGRILGAGHSPQANLVAARG